MGPRVPDPINHARPCKSPGHLC